MTQIVEISTEGALSILTIDNGPLNLFDRELIDALIAAVADIAADPPRGLLIEAQGPIVSAGVDVSLFDGLTPAQARQLWTTLMEMIHTVEELPLPTLFVAHGLCLTAAFELSLACDILLAGPRARFGLVEAVVGLTPSMGGTQRLAERAGPARARELVMTGDLYDAETLERWNVVNRILPGEGTATAARSLARALAEGPTRAHAATKAIVAACRDGGGARCADDLTVEVSAQLFDTSDLKGAVRSFLDDGPGRATFEGR